MKGSGKVKFIWFPERTRPPRFQGLRWEGLLSSTNSARAFVGRYMTSLITTQQGTVMTVKVVMHFEDPGRCPSPGGGNDWSSLRRPGPVCH